MSEPHPTLETRAEMYNSRIVALRTTLGRAGIELEARGIDHAIATPECATADHAGGLCVRCELGDTRRLDGATLEAITSAFDRYPTDALASANIERVALCSHIDHDSPDTAGTADLEGRRMMISLEPFAGRPYYDTLGEFTVEDIVHHEYFHLLESATMRDAIAGDPSWEHHNPDGFAYGKPRQDMARPAGFVDLYATSDAAEDRASVFQYLMARPDELCELMHNDAVIREKTRVIWQRITAVTGDGFLRARAGCVDPRWRL
ncbi:MAG: hypothetical protein ACM31C_17470 [Acidobacteriota bacterium]